MNAITFLACLSPTATQLKANKSFSELRTIRALQSLLNKKILKPYPKKSTIERNVRLKQHFLKTPKINTNKCRPEVCPMILIPLFLIIDFYVLTAFIHSMQLYISNDGKQCVVGP